MLADAKCWILFYNFSHTFQVSLHPCWQGSTWHYHWTIYCSLYINKIFVYLNLVILSIKSIANYKNWLKLIRYHNKATNWFLSIFDMNWLHWLAMIMIFIKYQIYRSYSYALCSAEYWTFSFCNFRISNFHQAMFNFPKLAQKLCHYDCVVGHFQHTVL